MKPDVTVVICAYTEERWSDLVEAVQSAQQQCCPPREVIVVIDHNPVLLARARTELSGVGVVPNEAARGLSGARNCGVAAAQGQKIAFLDDDAVAAPEWLERLNLWCDQPDVLGAGGRAEPAWVTSKPAWFPEEFYWVVGCSYRGLPREATPVRNVFGGCMCLRREIFDICGGFHCSIGRVESVPAGCEETELCIRARQHWPRGQFIYEPQAVIYHKVPAARTRWAYFRSRCYAEGQSKAQVARLVGAKDGLATEWGYTLGTLPRGVARGIGAAFSRRSPGALGQAGAILAGLAFTTLGYLAGRRLSKQI